MPKFQNVAPIGARHQASLRSIYRPESIYQRSREPVNRSGMTVRGRFPSLKMRRMIDWESQLERRACYRFEFSPGIKIFEEQPIPARFQIRSSVVKYTPDFRLVSHDGQEWIAEIKPYDHLQREDVYERLLFASRFYKSIGINYIVVAQT